MNYRLIGEYKIFAQELCLNGWICLQIAISAVDADTGNVSKMRSSMACYFFEMKTKYSVWSRSELGRIFKHIEWSRKKQRERARIFHKCVNAFRDRIKAVCTTALIHYSVRFATAPCNSHKYTGIFDCKKTTLTAPLRVLPMARRQHGNITTTSSSKQWAWVENGF